MLRFAIFMVSSAALAACANQVVDDRSRGDAAQTGTGGAGGGDVGAGGSGGSDLLPAFVAFENIAPAAQPDLVLGTAFAQFDAAIVDRGCTRREIGACVVTSCPAATEADSAMDADAGVMTVTGTAPVLPPSDDVQGGYQLYADAALFQNGDLMGASFTGARVPAFSDTIPAPLHSVEHVPALDTLTTLPRSGLELTWKVEGEGAGAFLFALEPSVVDPNDDIAYERMTCSGAASDGSLAIPAEAMEALEARGPFVVFAGTACGKNVAVGEWNVYFQSNDLVYLEGVVVE